MTNQNFASDFPVPPASTPGQRIDDSQPLTPPVVPTPSARADNNDAQGTQHCEGCCVHGPKHVLVKNVRYRRAQQLDQHDGMLGFISLDYCGLFVNDIALRRTRKGEFVLSYPTRSDNQGAGRHPRVLPTAPWSASAIKRVTFDWLGTQGL